MFLDQIAQLLMLSASVNDLKNIKFNALRAEKYQWACPCDISTSFPSGKVFTLQNHLSGFCSLRFPKLLIPFSLFLIFSKEKMFVGEVFLSSLFEVVLDKLVATVGTPPPDDTWHASLSEATPSGLPKEGHVACSPIRTPSGRSMRYSRASHPDDSISYLDMLFRSLTEISRSCTSFRQPATAYVPPPAE